ncbi:MAG: hypothetical protein GEU82_09460 [Luteitalea sp.]|nr:hypothetical protein [Luteitalea sp.]
MEGTVNQRQPGTSVLILECTPDPAYGPNVRHGQVAQLFDGLNGVLAALYQVRSETTIAARFAEADVISLDLHSPLKDRVVIGETSGRCGPRLCNVL